MSVEVARLRRRAHSFADGHGRMRGAFVVVAFPSALRLGTFALTSFLALRVAHGRLADRLAVGALLADALAAGADHRALWRLADLVACGKVDGQARRLAVGWRAEPVAILVAGVEGNLTVPLAPRQASFVVGGLRGCHLRRVGARSDWRLGLITRRHHRLQRWAHHRPEGLPACLVARCSQAQLWQSLTSRTDPTSKFSHVIPLRAEVLRCEHERSRPVCLVPVHENE
jgi:hypothetical protein